jgi:hypothetical protein
MASHAPDELERAAAVIGQAVAGAGIGAAGPIDVPDSSPGDPERIRITDARPSAASAAAD